MEIIIVLKNGTATPESPYVFKSEDDAMAKYESICDALLGDDFKDVYRLGDDFVFDRVNKYLEYFGTEILFYTRVSVL